MLELQKRSTEEKKKKTKHMPLTRTVWKENSVKMSVVEALLAGFPDPGGGRERRKNERRETMLVNSIEVTSFIKVCQMRRGPATRFALMRQPYESKTPNQLRTYYEFV